MAYQSLNAGELDKLVMIQTRGEVDDGGGGQTITWTDSTPARASISPGGGREFVAAQQLQPEITHTVKIRYRAGVTPKHRFAYVVNDVTRHFAIHVILDPLERHEQLVCFCSEISPT